MNKQNKKQMNYLKKGEEGITLIALVITIIVLLILAGISISMLSGDNNILKQATNAKTKTIEGTEKEAINVAYHGVLAEKLGNVEANSEFETALYNALTNNGYEVEVTSNGKKVKFTDTGHVYKLDIAKGTITGPKAVATGTRLLDMYEAGKNCTTENCTDETHLHIGDYVTYTPSNTSASVTITKNGVKNSNETGIGTGYDAEQTYTVDSSTQWRVLGLNANGEILLTTESPIKKSGDDPYLVLQGAESYIYCKKTLDKVCSIYENEDLGTIGSITIEDINAALGVEVKKDINETPSIKVWQSADTEKTNIDLYDGRESYTYRSGDYAPENYLGTGTKKANDIVYRDSYFYAKDSLTSANSVAKDMIFDGTDSGTMDKAYWVASPGARAFSSDAYFGPGGVVDGYAGSGDSDLFVSDGDWGAVALAVRPVVSLDSDITTSSIQKTTGSPATWPTVDRNTYGVERGYGSIDGTGVVE